MPSVDAFHNPTETQGETTPAYRERSDGRIACRVVEEEEDDKPEMACLVRIVSSGCDASTPATPPAQPARNSTMPGVPRLPGSVRHRLLRLPSCSVRHRLLRLPSRPRRDESNAGGLVSNFDSGPTYIHRRIFTALLLCCVVVCVSSPCLQLGPPSIL